MVNPASGITRASTSEMFGKVQEIPRRKRRLSTPVVRMAWAKLYAHWITLNYRESYDIFGCSGILFNHESPCAGSSL